MVGRWTGGDVTVSVYSFSFTHQRSDRPSLLFLKYSTSYFVLLSELRPRHIQFENGGQQAERVAAVFSGQRQCCCSWSIGSIQAIY